MKTSIDTIILFTPDYEITKDLDGLIIIPPPFDYKKQRYLNIKTNVKIKGGLEPATKAYFNRDLIKVDFIGFRCFVRFSIPAVLNNGVNFKPADLQGTKRAIKIVNDLLNEEGMTVNLEYARICRLDLFKNIETDEDFQAYKTLLREFCCKRMKLEDKYDTSLIWRNNSQEFVIYDKIAQMRNDGIDTSGYRTNTSRLEWKLKNSYKVKNALGITNVGDLYRNFDSLDELYKDVVRENFFPLSDEDISRSYDCKLESKIEPYVISDNNWLNNFLVYQGIEYLLQNHSIEELIGAVTNVCVGYSKGTIVKKIQRLIKRCRESKIKSTMSKKATSTGKIYADLYNELRVKLLSP